MAISVRFFLTMPGNLTSLSRAAARAVSNKRRYWFNFKHRKLLLAMSASG